MNVYPLLLLLLLLGAACQQQKQPQETAAAYINTEWAADPLWDDGLAEVATYDATRSIYEKPRQFAYTYITVKEEFNKEHRVKTDDYTRSDLYPVLKVNKFARIETDNYPYHFLTSLFFKRQEPHLLHKMTHSSQEWCGNTFKLFQQEGGGYQYLWSSYWDGQGNGQEKLSGQPWFEDGLSHTLRALVYEEGLQFEQPVLESQISNKANPPKTYPAKFSVSSDVLEGQAVWKVQAVLEEGKTNVYWFAKPYPNTLQRMQSWQGEQLQLSALERKAYW